MADTIRTKATLQTALADVGFPSQVSEQSIRDLCVTALNGGTAASVADGGTIAHGCGYTPTVVSVVGSIATDLVSVASVDGTNITVAIKVAASGLAGTTQTLYWHAF